MQKLDLQKKPTFEPKPKRFHKQDFSCGSNDPPLHSPPIPPPFSNHYYSSTLHNTPHLSVSTHRSPPPTPKPSHNPLFQNPDPPLDSTSGHYPSRCSPDTRTRINGSGSLPARYGCLITAPRTRRPSKPVVVPARTAT